jgi:hypothetical protein
MAIAPQPKARPRILERRDSQREAARTKRDVYTAVAERDHYQCRCCGRKGQYDATIAANALHRHHLVYRSKQGLDTTSNLVSLDAICHSLIHARQLWIIGDDANDFLQFEIHEAAVIDVFGTRPVPPQVRIVTARRNI